MARKRATGSTDPVVPDVGATASLKQAFMTNFKGTHVPESVGEVVDGLSLEGCLPLQYILGTDVLPLGQTISLVGEPESMKSTMGWHLLSRVVRDKHTPGVGVYLDVEKKTNPFMIRGLVANDDLFEDKIMKARIATVPEMCTAMQEYAQTYRTAIPNSDVPMVYLLDSLGALTSKEAMEAMRKTGDANQAAGYDNARAAADITRHFQTWVPDNLQSLPLLLIYINHLKVAIGDSGGANFGPPKKTSPGGSHKDYMNVATIEMKRDKGGKSAPMATMSRTLLRMKTLKASFAASGLKIEVFSYVTGPDQVKYEVDRMLPAFNETEEDFQRLHVNFGWDESLVELLTREKPTFEKDKLKALVQITHKGGDKYNCLSLDLRGAPAREVGAAIHADAELCKGIQDVIGVQRHRVFCPKP